MVKTVKITPEVAAVLRDHATIEPRAIILNYPEMPRSLYLAVDKVFKAVGGKWNGREGCHQFPEGATQMIRNAVCEGGEIVDQKKTLEQFFTPEAVAKLAIKMAGIGPGLTVLEPSAGAGHLAIPAAQVGASVTAVELDENLAKTLALASGFGLRGSLHVFAADFMEWTPGGEPFDVALLNPPFSRGQDMAHVRRAYDFLRPGGVLVAIMSPHWTFGEDKASLNFREWVWDSAHEEVWEMLPAGSFRESGTDVNTGILRIVKPSA